MILTQDKLQDILDYIPETGEFTWKINRGAAYVGRLAGFKEKSRYTRIHINQKRHYAHRLAWLYVYGVHPNKEIDHINCDPSDNRISNLREASRAQNCLNLRTRRPGLKGASWHRGDRRWQASIRVNGKSKYLGQFQTEKEAHEAHVRAAIAAHGEFARAA